MVSLVGLPLSMTTHTICITTTGAPGPAFEAAQEAGLCLSDGIAAQHGKRLMCTPDVRLRLSAAFHGSGVAGAATTQSRVPLCVGYCPAVAERFGLVETLNPFDVEGVPRFAFRLYCDSPHGLHISAPHAAGLHAGVAELLAQMKRADGGIINALDVTCGVDDGADSGAANIDLDSSSSSSAAADDDSVSTPPSNKWDAHWGRDALPPWDTGAASNALLDLLGSLSAEFARSAAIDVGCGSGRNALALAEADFADVVGVDIAEGALECARRNDVEGRVDWRRESVFDLLETSPIHRGRYSLVFDRQVFHDLRFVDEAKVMRTLLGLVAPAGGLLLLILGASEHSREVEARPEGPPKIGPPLVDRAELDEIIARFIAFDPSLDLRVALCRMSSFDATPTQSADAESPKCWIVGLRSGDEGL